MNPHTITTPITGAAARKKILRGVNAVYNVVKLTLGPEGKNAILPRSFNRGPRNTNDGVTISENIALKDPHERLVADFFKEASKKTNELAGDGTTGTGVIGGHLTNEMFKLLPEEEVEITYTPGTDTKKKEYRGVRSLRKEMHDAKEKVIAEITKKAKKIKSLEDLEKIALVSIGKEDAEAAKIVAQMTWDIARDANGEFVDNYIDVVEGYKGTIETETIRGMRFPAKLAHRAFMNRPERFEMVADDVKVLITNYKLDNINQIAAIVNNCKEPKLAVFAPEFSGQVLNFISKTIINKNGIYFYPIKCPSLRTEQLEDLAVYTGATLVDKDTGSKIENITTQSLGFAEKIVVKDTENKEDAILIGGKGEKIKRGSGTLITERQEVLKGQLKEARNEMSRGSLQRRIANLSSAVGVIRVGASTDAELLYLKLKIEDGVFACKAALQEGYVKGGGLCLKEIADKLPTSILTESLKAPYNQIQHNAGGTLDISSDVIDPAKVVRLEVEHGVSIAAQIITTDILIPDEREKNPAEGYEDIANAIKFFALWFAKHHGLIKENVDFQNEEMEKIMEKAAFEANKD